VFLGLTLTVVSVSPAQAQTAQDVVPPYPQFVRTVTNGYAGVVRGIYVNDVLALRVVQQPTGSPDFVSSLSGTATQFGLAADHGVIGLLAHNYRAGSTFFNLVEGQEVKIIYGDGTVEEYEISNILRYQALKPNSVTSDFVDLDTNETLSALEVFAKVYSGSHHVTLQTCIKKYGNLSWGRLFVIATPISK
jgi:hypothetical protein